MDELASILPRIVRQMDAEADTVLNGIRCGLANYCGHLGHTNTRRIESTWRDGIARHLRTNSFEVSTEHRYPATQKRCDLVVVLADGSECWIELKAAWRAWRKKDGGVIYNAPIFYNDYMQGPTADKTRSHSLLQDFKKLEQHAPDGVTNAVLALGFDDDSGTIVRDVEALAAREALRSRGWAWGEPLCWMDDNSSQAKIYCWLFLRRPSEGNNPMKKLSHIDEKGAARMVDVGGKAVTARRAVAEARVKISKALREAIESSTLAKGNLLEVARLAGIAAAKRTDELIPLCHSLPLEHVDVRLAIKGGHVYIRAEAATTGKTGVEMEAYTAAAVAALTVIDMGKAVDAAMVVESIRLIEKSGGRRGTLTPHPSEFPK